MVVEGAVGVMEHAPKNQFSHRRTIRLLRSGMTGCVRACSRVCMSVCVHACVTLL